MHIHCNTNIFRDNISGTQKKIYTIGKGMNTPLDILPNLKSISSYIQRWFYPLLQNRDTHIGEPTREGWLKYCFIHCKQNAWKGTKKIK